MATLSIPNPTLARTEKRLASLRSNCRKARESKNYRGAGNYLALAKEDRIAISLDHLGADTHKVLLEFDRTHTRLSIQDMDEDAKREIGEIDKQIAANERIEKILRGYERQADSTYEATRVGVEAKHGGSLI